MELARSRDNVGTKQQQQIGADALLGAARGAEADCCEASAALGRERLDVAHDLDARAHRLQQRKALPEIGRRDERRSMR
jgi:hypothetical protein